MKILGIIVCLAFLAGCAPEIVRSSTPLSPPRASDRTRIEVAEDARVAPVQGYSRVVPKDSVWELRGSVPQGAVYRRVGDVFSISGAHHHEAYLVISGERLVGFYLPVEQAYAPAQPETLKLR